MTERITREHIEKAAENAREAWQRLTGDDRAWQVNHGSPSNGITWNVKIADSGTPAPGTGFAGHIGKTARDAAETLYALRKAWDDARYAISNPQDGHPEHIDCADGCDLEESHQGGCRRKPGGRVICTDANHA